jgi:hypothetical protein
MDLTEVKRGKIARSAARRTSAAADTALQLWQLSNNLGALAEIVAVDIYDTRFGYIVTKIESHNHHFLI